MITIQPIGGLGNRLRVLHSALSLHSGNDKPFRFIWPRDGHMNCSYHDLFKNHQGFILKDASGVGLKGLINKIKIIPGFKQIGLSNYSIIYNDKKIIELKKNGYDFNRLFEMTSVLIKTHQWFYTAEHGRFMMPEPAVEIRERVKKITDTYPENIIGIHIRMGDNRMAQKLSTLDLFLLHIENEIRLNYPVHFFLSTDSSKTEEILLDKFPDYITVQTNKSLDRSTEKSAKDAFVDMLCLSKTKKIIGSYHSSFSDIAAILSGLEKKIVEPDNVE